MLFIRKIILTLFWIALMVSGSITVNYLLVELVALNKIKSDTRDLNGYTCVLVPGAGNSPLGEWQNPVFSARMNTCVSLFRRLHISHITCSGLVKAPYYNEPTDMKNFLVAKGIPDSVIHLDNLGINTHSTIKNYAKHGPCKSVVIISQRIHLARAVYAATIYGMDAAGFSAGSYTRYKNEFIIYEALARFKLTLQLLFQ